MIDRSALGAVGAPFELDVERGKIHEFARATASSHPQHFAGDHPVIPPTFLTTTFFWEQTVPDSNPWHRVQMSPERGMHAEQEYVFHGPPPRAGTRLTCRSRIAEMYDKQGKRGAEPWEVANVMVFLASDYSTYLTGEVVSVSSQHP